MQAVIFHFWSLELTPNLYRFVLTFLPFVVDLRFGKIVNALKESERIINTDIAHVQKISF